MKNEIKDEFFKRFCSKVESAYVTDGDGPMYTWDVRPKVVWEWIEEKLKERRSNGQHLV